jgi:muramidase (phage lysozyme)
MALDIMVPEVNPSGAPDDYQRISTSPNMFGGFGAEAKKELGHGLTTAGDTAIQSVTEFNQLNDQTHAAELHSDAVDKGLGLTSSHMELEGRAAQDNLPILKEKLRAIQQETESQAGNLYTKSLVAQNLRRSFDYMIEKATSHATTQLTAWRTKVAGNNITSATDVGSLAIQGGGGVDFGELDRQIGVVNAEAHNHFDQRYNNLDDPEQKNALDVDVSKMKGQAVKNWVETAMTNPKDPDNISTALKIFERYSSQIDPGTRLALDKFVRAAAQKRSVNRLADYYSTQEGRSVDMTLSPEMRGLLDTIHGSETPGGGYDTMYGGRSIKAVQPDFDYSDHPRVMTPAQFGPTSAFGRYQITKTTWDANRDKFNLTDISPESQDQFAAKLASQRYAKAYQGDAFKPFGELSGDLDQDLKEHRDNPRFLAAVGQALSGEWTSLPGGLQVNAQTASFVQRFQKNIAINNGEAPVTPADPSVITQKILSDPLFANRPELQQQVLQQTLARISMMSRAEALEQKAQKAASDGEELKFFFAIHGNQPVTLDDINAAPNMTREAKERMGEQLLKLKGTEEKEENTYGSGFYDLYRKIHLPDGNADRITDESQLYSHVGPNGDLSVKGVDKLVAEIQARKSPEGVAESEMKAQFLKNARAQITGSDEGLHIKDPKGDELYLKFLAQVLPQYDAERRAGKSAQSLFNPDSADYLGAAIKGFRRKPEDWYADIIADHDQKDQGFDETKIKTLDDLQKAYRDGNVTREKAIQMAVDKGWATRKAPEAPMPQVPRSVPEIIPTLGIRG